MKGKKPFSTEQLDAIRDYYDNIYNEELQQASLGILQRGRPKSFYAKRNLTLILFGCFVGLRAGELMSLEICDVYSPQHGISDSVYLRKRNSKGKVEGRRIPLNKASRDLLLDYLEHYGFTSELVAGSRPLFFNTKIFESRLSVRTVERIVKEACMGAGIPERDYSSHSLRKTFASRMYNLLDQNILNLQSAMGHKNIDSTSKYIQADNTVINQAFEELKI